MDSDRVATGMRMLVATMAGAAAAWSAAAGLYATTALALLVAAWTGGAAVFALQPPLPPPPPPPVPAGEHERRRLVAYLDLSPAPLVVLEDGVLRAVNRAARKLFGADDTIAAAPPALLAVMTQTAPGRTATVTLDQGGSGRPFALAAGEVLLGGRVAQVGALIDIGAELKAAEAGALRDLVQVLSHEIVNALTPIASLAETAAAMLRDTPPDLAAVREAVETVARRSGGLQRFGDTYRSLARLPAPQRRRVAIAGLTGDLARLFAVRWPGIALEVDVVHAPAVILADPDQLSAALWAILQNAAEAMTDAAVADPAARLDATTTIDALAFTIANRGPGIAPDLAETIFHPFMTTKPQGSGVGLALARQIVRGHGGEIALMPATKGWTAFVVSLPLPRGF